LEINETIDEELFDVLYYVLALANVYGIDMNEAVVLKEKVNSTG
jgi:NTP pyrophosphatase (non-canonical NTP hydrolase)